MHLVRAGGKEAHLLAGTQISSICLIRYSKPRIRGSASPRQHNGNHLHKENGGDPHPVPVQDEPSVVATSHQEEHHHSLPLVALHIGEPRGRFPQQKQTANVGLQTDLIRVLEGLQQISSLAYTGCLCIQRESSDSRVHDLGAAPQGNGNECPGLLLGSRNLVIPPGPSHFSISREQKIEVILICPGWKGAMWWPQLVKLKTEIASIHLPALVDCLKFPKGSTEEIPKLDPLYAFHISGKVI